MALIEIVPATIEHATHIAERLSEADKAEQWAGGYLRSEQAVQRAIKLSEIAMTGMVDGVPVALWGSIRQSMMFNIGSPWLFVAEMSSYQARHFIRHCREPIYQMAASYDKMQGYVDARHTRAIRWLKWAGFEFDEKPRPMGVQNMPFYRYWLEAKT